MSSVNPEQCLVVELVQAIDEARAKKLPFAILKKITLHVADALAIGVAARTEKVSQHVIQGQLAGSGSGSCPLIGGGTASAMAASFINSAMIHMLDFDDIYDAGRLHPGAVVIPAVMAAAELNDASDEQVIEAITYACELMSKLGAVAAPEGKGPGADWFLTQLFGYIAAALGAGMVLGLSNQQLVSAIGLAYMQAAGGKEAGFGVGSTARSIYPAFAAQGGLQSALLAKAGVAGPQSALDGAASLFKIYFGEQLAPDKRRSLLDFSVWNFMGVEVKPWPSCRLSHPYVAVALDSREVVLQNPGASLRVAVNASAARLCHPLPERCRPLTLQDAKYSIPFMTAFALVHGHPTLANLNHGILLDTDVLDMALRIEVQEVLPDNPGHPQAVLMVFEHTHKIYSSEFVVADLQMDASQIQSKFMACFVHANATDIALMVWSQVGQGHLRNAMKILARLT